MKAVIISVRPNWCAKITNKIGIEKNGKPIYEKTVEVRKTRPKIETPFKCYIYCTLQGSREFFEELQNKLGTYEALCKWNRENWGIKKGKVIGEFVCDRIGDMRDIERDPTCLSIEEWLKYTDGHKGIVYGWHISDLVIYDKPKELGEFTGLRNTKFGYEPIKIKIPPQSWCYVEVQE